MALASTLCTQKRAQVCCEQTSSIPQHGRIRRGREWKSSFGDEYMEADSPHGKVSNTGPYSCLHKKKRKEKVQQKLNKSLEQGLNLSGS